ncbi:MAG: cysteine desulfurase [Bacteroidales bacterium]|jgi:cysteine desulfurase/selenocysteine lyase|nr:cysteine desulfurase [Bacteroidales bacterium]
MLDVLAIRRDFPILSSQVYGKPLVYLDNAATTQKPQCVVDKLTEGYLHHNANVHRGVHFLSQDATDLHEGARRTVQKFLNAASSDEIIFTRGTTESINLVASSFGDAFLREGDEVIVSEMEHHSNIVSWQLLQRRHKIVIKVVGMNDRQELDMDHFRSLFSSRTKLVSITQVSNVLGTVNPIKEIIRIAHSHQVPVLVDGAQSTPHQKVDVQDLDADFLVFSGHKVYGPTGVGVLYGKRQWLDQMPPYQGGGEMIQTVSFGNTTFNELPYKFEAGTPDFIGTVGLATALDYVSGIGLDNIADYEHQLLTYATDEFQRIPGMRIFGNAAEKSAVLSFLVDGIHHYDMGLLLDKLGIAVRTGHHCAQPLMESLGIEGTVRASFSFYNTQEEVDALVAGVKRVCKMFGV